MNAQPLGRFGHFKDPAIDFAFEVEKLANMVEGFKFGAANSAGTAERIDRAMEFRVGGSLIAIDAKARLRGIVARFEAIRTPRRLNWIELGALIEPLRAEEASAVTLICDNPDGNPNNAVECWGDWTGWNILRFTGETLADALRAAVAAQTAASTRGSA